MLIGQILLSVLGVILPMSAVICATVRLRLG
jgi:hypothetical protein